MRMMWNKRILLPFDQLNIRQKQLVPYALEDYIQLYWQDLPSIHHQSSKQISMSQLRDKEHFKKKE